MEEIEPKIEANNSKRDPFGSISTKPGDNRTYVIYNYVQPTHCTGENNNSEDPFEPIPTPGDDAIYINRDDLGNRRNPIV